MEGLIDLTKLIKPLRPFALCSVYKKEQNMNLYEERVCTNCGNNNCTHKIKEVQRENETIIKCDDFICKNKRKKMPRNWQE